VSKDNTGKFGVRVVSLLLIAGGIVGLVTVIWSEISLLQQTGFRPSSMAAFFGAGAVLFGFSTWTGVDLWRGKPSALRRAKVLFAAQIPYISLPGFVCQFFTGFMFTIFFNSASASRFGLAFRFGSYLRFWISSAIENLVLGVNVVAVIVLIYLIRVASPEHGKKQERFGLI